MLQRLNRRRSSTPTATRSVRRSGARLAALGLLACSALVVLAPGAAARHIDSIFKTDTVFNFDCFDGTLEEANEGEATFCQTDNTRMTVWRSGTIPSDAGERTNIGGVLADEFRPTDLDVVFVTNPVYGGDSETDIIYKKQELPAGTAGTTWCNDAVEGGPDGEPCDQHYVLFDVFISRNVACHESGHAVGLTHGSAADPPRKQLRRQSRVPADGRAHRRAPRP